MLKEMAAGDKVEIEALRATLERAKLPFEYDVAVMKITVAALMTTAWIARRLEVPPVGFASGWRSRP